MIVSLPVPSIVSVLLSASKFAYTVFVPVPAESVHAVVGAYASRHDRLTPSLENCIFIIQAPEMLRVTAVPVVEAASLLITNDPENSGAVWMTHRLAWLVVN